MKPHTHHTYLFKKGRWIAHGIYSDAVNTTVPAEGDVSITHGRNAWILDGSMKLMTSEPVEFQNRYEITPFKKGSDFTRWTSVNPALGKLHGTFMVVVDSIISLSTSEDSVYSCCEFLTRVSDTEYRNRGFAFMNGKKLSSWAVTLVKAE